MIMLPPVTLKDLAKELGLSVPAVSLGLRHAGNISEATCRRIEEAAKRMGYRPNPHAAALSSRVHTGAKHGVPLAILRLPLKQNSGHFYPIPHFIDGITRRAGELGYCAQVLTVEDYATLPRQLRVLYNQGIQGIFLPPVGRNFGAGDIDWNPFSVVACGRYDQASPFHTIRQEIFESTRLLLNETIRRGYSRICIALVRHDPEIVDDFARIAAASVCHPARGNKIKVHFSSTDRRYDFLDWLQKEKVDAVIGFTAAHYYTMVEAGIKIPEEIGFAALHGWEGEWGGHVSALMMPDSYAGTVAANRMDAMIRHHERGIPETAEQIALPGKWKEGTTLPFRGK